MGTHSGSNGGQAEAKDHSGISGKSMVPAVDKRRTVVATKGRHMDKRARIGGHGGGIRDKLGQRRMGDKGGTREGQVGDTEVQRTIF